MIPLRGAEHLLLIRDSFCANQTWELVVPGAEGHTGVRTAYSQPLQNTG